MASLTNALLLAAALFAAPAAAERIYSNDMLATKLIGAAVTNGSGEDLGEIRDLAIDLEGQRVNLALLAFGGLLGFGEKVFPLPVAWFAPGRGGKVMLDMRRAELESGAGFERYRQPSDFLRASDLIGDTVEDRHGDEAGKLQDLVVNLGDGRVRHAMLMLKRPERQVTVRPPVLSAGSDAGQLVLDMDLAELRAMIGAGGKKYARPRSRYARARPGLRGLRVMSKCRTRREPEAARGRKPVRKP